MVVFRLMREQWTVSKGVREIVKMGERDGFLRPDKREHTIKGILEFSRDAEIVRKDIPTHQQVMVAVMAFFGIAMGPMALSDATRWAGEYANRHNQQDALALCMERATNLIEAVTQAEGKR
jgi:hypothetical protein